jgi:hypothetical protein
MGKYDHQGSFTFWGNHIYPLPDGLGINVNYSMYSSNIDDISIDDLGIVFDEFVEVDAKDFSDVDSVIKANENPLHKVERSILIKFFSLIYELQIEAWEDFQSKRKVI